MSLYASSLEQRFFCINPLGKIIKRYRRNQENMYIEIDRIKFKIFCASGAYFSPFRASYNKPPAMPAVL